MSGWQEFELGCAICTNKTTVNQGYVFQEILYLDTGSITRGKIDKLQRHSLADAPSRAKRLVKHGDIIYSAVRPIQRHYGYIENPAENLVVSTGFVVISCDQEKLNSKFIYYYLTSDQIVEELDIIAEASTSTYPSLKPSDIEKLTVKFPVRVDEQRAIAAVLSSLDDKIDLLHRQNKTLETMAETLFRHWFVINVREDWEEKMLGDWLDNTFGGDWGKETPEGDFVVPVNCIRGTDIADLSNGLAEKTPIRFVKKKRFSMIQPKNGDIIFEISGGTENQSTGRSIYINDIVSSLFDYPLVFSNFCRLLRPAKKEYSFFIYLYLQYLYKLGEFFALENGSSGIKNLNYKALLFDLSYPMPSQDLVIEFDFEIEPFFKKINKNKQQIRTLQTLRDTLLPKLMSGEVRVSL